MGERYSGGGLDLASYQTLQGGRGVRKVFWNSSSPEAARLDQFERRLEVFLRNPIIEGTIVASSFSTAETGRRVEILADSAARVRFYSGEAGETDNGVINTQSFGGREIANWVPPELGSNGTYRAQISLYARDGSNTSWARFFADDIEMTAAGDITFNATQVLFPDGSAASPSVSFGSDNNLGFYRISADALAWSGAGTFGGFLHAGGVRTVDGSVSVPAVSFTGNSDLGFFRSGASLNVTIDNRHVGQWRSDGLSLVYNSGVANFLLIDSGSANPIILDDGDNDGNCYIRFRDNAGALTGLMGIISSVGIVRTDNRELHLRTQNSQAIRFITNGVGRWYVNATTGDLRPDTSGGADLGTSTFEVGQIFALLSSGTGDNLEHNSSNEIVYDTSTRRHKFDRRPWRPASGSWLDAIDRLEPTSWNRAVTTFVDRENRTEDPRTRIEHRPGVGLIAENVHDVLGPIAATYEDDGRVRNYRDRAVIAALVGAVQELRDEVNALRSRRP